MTGGPVWETNAAPAPTTRAAAVTPAVIPLLFLLPVAVGVAISVIRLVQVRYPAYGWTLNVDSDAQAMSLGIWPFQDPAHGYTGNAYTPLYQMLVSLPDHLYRWSGWSVLITIAAGIATSALVARLAWRGPQRPGAAWRALALAEAAGIGALGWSLVFSLQQHQLFNGKNDQLASLLSLGAVLLVPAAVSGRRRSRLALILLVTAAFWAKQTAIVAAVAVAGGFIAAVVTGRMRTRDVLTIGGITLALNVALLAVADLASGGWLLRWTFGIHLPADESYGHALRTLLPHVAIGLALAALMGAAARTAAGRRVRLREFAATDSGLLTVSLITLAVFGCAEGLYLLRFAGGADNDAMLMVWAVAALVAIAYRAAGARQETRVLAALLCTLVAVTTVSGIGDWRLRRGHVVPNAAYPAIPDSVTSYAKAHLVYHAGIPLSFVREREGAYPTLVHIREDVSRGYTPWPLVHALVERRFAGVFGLFAPDPVEKARNKSLIPGEQNFWWKLNVVINANYKLVPGTPTIPAGPDFLSEDSVPMRVPRSGSPARWLASCFGPFRAGGMELAIHQGGGLWCRGPGNTLTLRGTPARASQLVSTRNVGAPRGELTTSVERAAGWWSIGVQGAWTLRADVEPASGVRLSLTRPGYSAHMEIPAEDLHRSRGTVRVVFASGDGALSRGPGQAAVRVPVPVDASGRLTLWSSAPLGTKFDLSGLSA